MEKCKNDIPKAYMKLGSGLMLELMEECPPFPDTIQAKSKRKELKEELQIKIRVMQHNGRYFLYRVIGNQQCRR